MELDVKQIGVFGINFSAGFDQTWVTFWRKDDHWDVEFFAMVGDDDPVETEPPVSIEEGERIIAKAIAEAGIEQWTEHYGDEDPDQVPGLVWTLDIDDLDRNDIVLYSGNGGIPPRAQFDALIAAAREAMPEFAVGMECFE